MTQPNPARADASGPYIVIYGDPEGRPVSGLFWGVVGGLDIGILQASTPEMLIGLAPDALMIVIHLPPDSAPDSDATGPLADLDKCGDLVGEVVAVAPGADTARRLGLLAAGYDLVLNPDDIGADAFHAIIKRRLDRARAARTSRIMEEEYLRFREALKASPDAFIVFDDRDRIFFVSEHYKRAYPKIADRFVRGLHVMDAFELARVEQGVGDDDPRFPGMKAFWEKMDGQAEFRVRMAGENRYWRIRAAKLDNGMGTIVTTTDITDIVRQKREIEEKSRQLTEALEKEQEASAMQKQFISMVSHEFRTPLAIIDGHAQLLLRRRDETAEAVETRLKTIRSAVSRLVHMMESILSSSLLKTGRMEAIPRDFDLRQLIVDLCQEQMVLAPPGSITWDVDGLPDTVCLDEKMMMLALSNLISNAVKFSPDKPHIVVRAYSDEHDGTILITVSDNGRGIPADEIPRVFERYYRATTASGIPGTGIGLNLVHDLVLLQGGQIEVDSTQGEGTTFTLKMRIP